MFIKLIVPFFAIKCIKDPEAQTIRLHWLGEISNADLEIKIWSAYNIIQATQSQILSPNSYFQIQLDTMI